LSADFAMMMTMSHRIKNFSSGHKLLATKYVNEYILTEIFIQRKEKSFSEASIFTYRRVRLLVFGRPRFDSLSSKTKT